MKKELSKKKVERRKLLKSAKANDYIPGTDVTLIGLKEAIQEALFEQDFDTFRGCVSILLEKVDYKSITQATKLSKTTLYRMTEPDSNPTLENTMKVLHFINQCSKEKEAA